jgi:hypothetical protein
MRTGGTAASKERRETRRTGTGAQLPKLPPSRPTALPTRKYPEAHSCGSKLPPKQHGAEQAMLSVGRQTVCGEGVQQIRT